MRPAQSAHIFSVFAGFIVLNLVVTLLLPSAICHGSRSFMSF